MTWHNMMEISWHTIMEIEWHSIQEIRWHNMMEIRHLDKLSMSVDGQMYITNRLFDSLPADRFKEILSMAANQLSGPNAEKSACLVMNMVSSSELDFNQLQIGPDVIAAIDTIVDKSIGGDTGVQCQTVDIRISRDKGGRAEGSYSSSGPSNIKDRWAKMKEKALKALERPGTQIRIGAPISRATNLSGSNLSNNTRTAIVNPIEQSRPVGRVGSLFNIAVCEPLALQRTVQDGFNQYAMGILNYGSPSRYTGAGNDKLGCTIQVELTPAPEIKGLLKRPKKWSAPQQSVRSDREQLILTQPLRVKFVISGNGLAPIIIKREGKMLDLQNDLFGR
jgi:hypothetical protein